MDEHDQQLDVLEEELDRCSTDSTGGELSDSDSTDGDSTDSDSTDTEPGNSLNYYYMTVDISSVNDYSNTKLNVDQALDRVGISFGNRYIQTIVVAEVEQHFGTDRSAYRAIPEVLRSKDKVLIVMFDNQSSSNSFCLGREATILERSSANNEEIDPQFVLWNVRDEHDNLQFAEPDEESRWKVINEFKKKMKKNFKAGKFIVVTTRESAKITNRSVCVYPIDTLVEEMIKEVGYRRGQPGRPPVTKNFIHTVSFNFFRKRTHLMLTTDQLSYVETEMRKRKVKTSPTEIDEQLRVLKSISDIVQITRFTYHTIRTSVSRYLIAETLSAKEAVDQWVEVYVLSVGDQFEDINADRALADFRDEFPDEHVTKSAFMDLVRAKARSLGIQPNGYSDEQLAYLGELLEKQRQNQKTTSPDPINYMDAFNRLNSMPGKKLTKVSQVSRYVNHHAGHLIHHKKQTPRTQYDELSAGQQAKFQEILKEVKSKKQLSYEEKQSYCDEINEVFGATEIITVEYFTKKISEWKVELAKKGDKSVKRGHANKYKWANIQRAQLNGSGTKLDSEAEVGGFEQRERNGWLRPLHNKRRLKGERKTTEKKGAGGFSNLVKSIKACLKKSKGLTSRPVWDVKYGTKSKPAGATDFEEQYDEEQPEPFELAISNRETLVERKSKVHDLEKGELIKYEYVIRDSKKNTERPTGCVFYRYAAAGPTAELPAGQSEVRAKSTAELSAGQPELPIRPIAGSSAEQTEPPAKPNAGPSARQTEPQPSTSAKQPYEWSSDEEPQPSTSARQPYELSSDEEPMVVLSSDDEPMQTDPLGGGEEIEIMSEKSKLDDTIEISDEESNMDTDSVSDTESEEQMNSLSSIISQMSVDADASSGNESPAARSTRARSCKGNVDYTNQAYDEQFADLISESDSSRSDMSDEESSSTEEDSML